jgi:hypothetical protein
MKEKVLVEERMTEVRTHYPNYTIYLVTRRDSTQKIAFSIEQAVKVSEGGTITGITRKELEKMTFEKFVLH